MDDNICDRCYRKPYYCDIRAHGSGGETISCTSFHPQTHADRIRAMSDEELAELWWERVDCGECPVHKECKLTGKDCKRLALDWLRQEANLNEGSDNLNA